MSGKTVPDNYTANHKCASNFFNRFVTQENQYLLGNGVTFSDKGTKEKLGKDFDIKIQQAGKYALIEGVSFGFWNFNHMEVFKLTEFVPIYDEETGDLMAGIRYWRVNKDKPLRMTLYEPDGYTEYIENNQKLPKREYKQIITHTAADGEQEITGENYNGFPIVPLYGNTYRQSELVGKKGQIDAYDLIKSGFANDLDDCSMIYWTLENCGGMDDIDLAKFVERMKTIKAAVIDGETGARASAHTLDIPYQSREAYLSRLENDLYNDAMALNASQISAGNITATQINAAYEPLNSKTDEYEYCVIDFIQKILKIAGIDDTPSFKRSKIINQAEETQMIIQAANYLDDETILNHLPWLTTDEVQKILDNRVAEEQNRFTQSSEAYTDIQISDVNETIDIAEEAKGKTLNGAQTQSLITVINSLSNGTLSEGQAVAIISTSIGVSKDEARKIIRGE